MAQQSGLGYDLDQLLLDEACRKAALWREGFPEHYPPMISVSLSENAIFRESLHDEISRTIKEAGLPGHALMIGFTEEIITENPERAVAALEPIKALDVRLAVDGFGSGRSSLGFLHRLPADTLKVDPSFVRHIGEAGKTEDTGWRTRTAWRLRAPFQPWRMSSAWKWSPRAYRLTNRCAPSLRCTVTTPRDRVSRGRSTLRRPRPFSPPNLPGKDGVGSGTARCGFQTYSELH